MDYGESLRYLYSLGHEVLAAKLGLESITLLLERLAHPERSFKSVLVAGTNGKGSVSAMIDSIARAAGHLPATALPWESGNAVIAGHRDTFFKPLKDLRDGDEIRMTTTHGTFDYRVTRTQIVEPDDMSVLAPTSSPSLTLVTCYPFVYVGSAPQRFIVQARLR